MIWVGLSWSRTLEPRELGLRGFRTLPPPVDPNRAHEHQGVNQIQIDELGQSIFSFAAA